MKLHPSSSVQFDQQKNLSDMSLWKQLNTDRLRNKPKTTVFI